MLAGVGTAEPSYDGWPLVKARADVDIVMGRFDAASATLDTLSDLPWTVGVPDIVRSRAELALWRGDPLEAVQLLAPLLVDSDDACANQATSVIPSTTLELGTVGRLLVLLARAAADVAAAAPGRRVELQETIRDAAKHHSGVFDPGGFPSDLAANGQFEDRAGAPAQEGHRRSLGPGRPQVGRGPAPPRRGLLSLASSPASAEERPRNRRHEIAASGSA